MLYYETIHPDTLELLKKIQSLVKPLSSSKAMRFLIVDGVKIDIVSYPYDWIDDPIIEDGVILAGVKDIASMKLSAITNRGTKKDFIDLFFLLKRYSFNELVDFFLTKYSDAQLFTVLKSLTYFEDAETDPMPVMAEPVNWDEIKTAIVKAVHQYINHSL